MRAVLFVVYIFRFVNFCINERPTINTKNTYKEKNLTKFMQTQIGPI